MVRIVAAHVLNAGEYGVWEDIFAKHDGSLASQSPQWAKTITALGRYRAHPIYYRFDDGIEAVLPLYTFGLGPLRYAWSPPPGWGFGGLVCTERISAAHLRAVLAHCMSLPFLGIKIRPNPLQAGLWESAQPRGWKSIGRLAHTIDISDGYEALQKKFSANTRNSIKRATRNEVEIEYGNSPELVEEFYYLLQKSRLRWAKAQNELPVLTRLRGNLVDPKKKFHAMAEHLPDVFTVYVARVKQTPAAAFIVLNGKQFHDTRGAIDKKIADDTHASYLLQAVAIEHACQAGASHYHMGESGNSKNLAFYKTRFGASALSYAEYYYEALPLVKADRLLRDAVKRVTAFRDAETA